MRRHGWIVLCLLVGSPASAEPFGLVHSESGTGLAPAGSLGELLLVARDGESIEAIDPSSGAVARTFARPLPVPRLGEVALAIGSELWVGAPEADGFRGAVLVFDSTSGELLRTISPDPSYPEERFFGRTMAATATRVIVGAPASDDGNGSVHLFDAATGAHLRRIDVGGDHFGAAVAAGEHAFFVARPFDGFRGEVHQLDEEGELLRILETPNPAERTEFFGESVAVVGPHVYIGAHFAAGFVGRVYRFAVDTGSFEGSIGPPGGIGRFFGESISGAGGGLLVGEPGHLTASESRIGAAHLFDAATGLLRRSFPNPTYVGGDESFGARVLAMGHHAVVLDDFDEPAQTGVYVFANLEGCGDGTMQAPEGCDDGNRTSGDGCDANCTATGCGNAVTTAGEICDDGNRTDGDTCDSSCLPAGLCGDGVVVDGELCDDGNLVDGDGCDHDCTPTGCGNGIRTANEDCDDGNQADGDGCPSDCSLVLCGDGVVEAEEECDDGNEVDEGVCSPFCTQSVGPYPVGALDFAFTYFSPAFGAERTIETRIWYPAASQHPSSIPHPPLDVPVARGRFPLVVESHGFGNVSFELVASSPRAYFLARNGFIVATPLHPGDSFAVFQQVLEARPQDIRALLDRLLDKHAVPSLLRNHIDPDRIGTMGQSLGGITATATTVNGFNGSVRDPRVKAVLGSGSENYLFRRHHLETSRVPIMLVIGENDAFFSGPNAIQSTYQRHSPPRFLVEVLGGDHFVGTGFSCELPFCRKLGALRYALAFFATYLRNDPSEKPLLLPGAESEFGGVEYSSDPGPRLFLGGSGSNECMVALGTTEGDGLEENHEARLGCVDGASCDLDPSPGRCGFDVSICVNVVDRRVIRCAPTDVALLAVRSSSRDNELAALRRASETLVPTSSRMCTAPSRLTVRIPPGHARATRNLRVKAIDVEGRKDSDAFLLSCERP